ncbi:MAG: glycoside hydrolase family 2 protein [archaeon]|nr:glycoside hydrolase family 2 protein [archaeon]
MNQERIELKNWKFKKEEIANGGSVNIQDNDWKDIQVPHTWNSHDVQSGGSKMVSIGKKKEPGYYRGTGWYRTWVKIPESASNQRIFIKFEAIGDISEVFCNGSFVGKHEGAFAAICYEITSLVTVGENALFAVRANNAPHKHIPPRSGDFPVMGGIYRPAYLLIKNQICISPVDYASPGVYITQSNISDESAVVDVKVKVDSSCQQSEEIKVKLTVNDGESQQVFSNEGTILASSKEISDYSTSFSIESPHLWNGRMDPYMYSVCVEIFKGAEKVDESVQPLGLRYYHVDPEKGFFLNGKSYPIYGVARHQDRQDKGWALSAEDQDEDADLIYDMGARGVRCSHYQHNDYFYQRCDEKGLFVWAEISLVNTVQFDQQFWETASLQLIEMIRQSYNHPSIFCWGIGNELGLFQIRDPTSVVLKLHNLAKKEDPTRYTAYAAIMAGKFRKKLNNVTDILGVNLYPGWYAKKAEDMGEIIKSWQKAGKNRGVGVSEYGAGASLSHHEWPLGKWGMRDSFGNWHPEERQAYVHEVTFRHLKESPFVWGTFVWNMFDFAVASRNEGDTPGRNDKGLVSYDRKVKKDAYFFYQANLTDNPMVHITSRRWTERSEANTRAKVYSNCDSVELKLNGGSLGNMQKGSMNVFILENLTLVPGENTVEVIATVDGKTFTDSCTWTLK